jgi:hypothetical protein
MGCSVVKFQILPLENLLTVFQIALKTLTLFLFCLFIRQQDDIPESYTPSYHLNMKRIAAIFHTYIFSLCSIHHVPEVKFKPLTYNPRKLSYIDVLPTELPFVAQLKTDHLNPISVWVSNGYCISLKAYVISCESGEHHDQVVFAWAQSSGLNLSCTHFLNFSERVDIGGCKRHTKTEQS